MSLVTNVNGEQFNRIVGNSKDQPVVAYYWAPWCGPCKQQGPIMEQVAKEFEDQIIFIKINTDDELKVATDNNVQGLPAIHVFEKGELTQVFKGAQSARKLIKALSEPAR